MNNKHVKTQGQLFNKKALSIGFGILCLAVGGYLLLILFSARFAAPFANNGGVDSASISDEHKNWLIIPKIGVRITYEAGGAEVLENHAWWRHSDRGRPGQGNFILSAHRFRIGWTPAQTSINSPFYNIHKLDVGDEILIWHGREDYKYEISKKYRVEPYAIEIEAPSEEHKLTLYSCSFGGEQDGRDVIEATLLKRVANETL